MGGEITMEDNIKDDVVVEEEVKEVETKPEAKYTDEDVDKILNQKFAKWQEDKEKEISEAQKLANMTAEEKIQAEKEAIEEELNQLRNAQTQAEMTNTARGILKAKKIDIDDRLIKVLITDNAEDTKANVEAFTELFTRAVNQGVLDKIKDPNNRRGTTSKITREEIMAIEDIVTRQEKIKENIHLFE